ncbi:MAG: hypothetical protein ACKO9T_01775, partial [Nitrospira sp.]
MGYGGDGAAGRDGGAGLPCNDALCVVAGRLSGGGAVGRGGAEGAGVGGETCVLAADRRAALMAADS